MKKLLIFLLILFGFSTTFAGENTVSIIDLDSSNSNLLKVYFDKQIETNSYEINQEAKLFKDLQTESINKEVDNKTVVIKLKDELEKNNSYSILSIYGVEGNIDFKIDDIVNGLEISGVDDSKIEKLKIVDKSKIEIIFKDEITAEDIDIKVLKEYKINSMSLDEKNNKQINAILQDKLDSDSNFLLMWFSFSTKEAVDYSIENYIYNFKTKASLQETKIEKPKEVKEEEKIKNVALNSAETPDTGAETWILLLATFLVSNFVYFRKKFSK